MPNDFSHIQDGDWIRINDGSIVQAHIRGDRIVTVLLPFNRDGTPYIFDHLQETYGHFRIVEKLAGPPITQEDCRHAVKDALSVYAAETQELHAQQYRNAQTMLRSDYYRSSALTGILAHSGHALKAHDAARYAIEAADELERQRDQPNRK